MQWTYVKAHNLKRWGQGSDDLAAIGLPAILSYATLVTPTLECKSCGKREHVQMAKHHPGGCGAFE